MTSFEDIWNQISASQPEKFKATDFTWMSEFAIATRGFEHDLHLQVSSGCAIWAFIVKCSINNLKSKFEKRIVFQWFYFQRSFHTIWNFEVVI